MTGTGTITKASAANTVNRVQALLAADASRLAFLGVCIFDGCSSGNLRVERRPGLDSTQLTRYLR